MDPECAISLISANISQQAYHAEKHFPNVVDFDGQYLGPYVPFIGKAYFAAVPRVMMYGMAQNLCKNDSVDMMRSWANKADGGVRRFYYEAPRVNMLLWDSGNLKVIAALAMSSWPNSTFNPARDVYDLVALTNFVKFSFYQEKDRMRKDVNPPKEIYDEMWKRYCEYEIRILNPNVIIACGEVVADAIGRHLPATSSAIILLHVPFPFGRPLPRYIHLGKKFQQEHGFNPQDETEWLLGLMKGTPDPDGSIRAAIDKNWYFFREIRLALRKRLSKIPSDTQQQ